MVPRFEWSTSTCIKCRLDSSAGLDSNPTSPSPSELGTSVLCLCLSLYFLQFNSPPAKPFHLAQPPWRLRLIIEAQLCVDGTESKSAQAEAPDPDKRLHPSSVLVKRPSQISLHAHVVQHQPKSKPGISDLGAVSVTVTFGFLRCKACTILPSHHLLVTAKPSLLLSGYPVSIRLVLSLSYSLPTFALSTSSARPFASSAFPPWH